MLMVDTDAVVVERLLLAGELTCPVCGGVLAPWGHARWRSSRLEHGGVRHRGAAPSPSLKRHKATPSASGSWVTHARFSLASRNFRAVVGPGHPRAPGAVFRFLA